MILIKKIWSSVKIKIKALRSSTLVWGVSIFVLLNMFWAYVFLLFYNFEDRLDLLNVLGTWIGSIATFSAVFVSLYISLNHHYKNLKISVSNEKIYTMVIENFNKFPVAFNFDRSAQVDNLSLRDTEMVTAAFAKSFRVNGGHKESSYIVVDPISIIIIEYFNSDFADELEKHPEISLYDCQIEYTLEIETLAYHQKVYYDKGRLTKLNYAKVRPL